MGNIRRILNEGSYRMRNLDNSLKFKLNGKINLNDIFMIRVNINHKVTINLRSEINI
jgi:hypothetical protein